MVFDNRVSGFDNVKIGDCFRVPKQVTYDLDGNVLNRVLMGFSAPFEQDVYIRLLDGDKLLDNSQKNGVE